MEENDGEINVELKLEDFWVSADIAPKIAGLRYPAEKMKTVNT